LELLLTRTEDNARLSQEQRRGPGVASKATAKANSRTTWEVTCAPHVVCQWLGDLASTRIITWHEPMLAAEARASATDLVKTIYACAELPDDL
jgi:hypothetical protein